MNIFDDHINHTSNQQAALPAEQRPQTPPMKCRRERAQMHQPNTALGLDKRRHSEEHSSLKKKYEELANMRNDKICSYIQEHYTKSNRI